MPDSGGPCATLNSGCGYCACPPFCEFFSAHAELIAAPLTGTKASNPQKNLLDGRLQVSGRLGHAAPANQLKDKHDQREDEKDMDQAAAYRYNKCANCPKDEEDEKNGPQHVQLLSVRRIELKWFTLAIVPD